MADFMITGPDGSRYKVSGASEEGALRALRQALGKPAADKRQTDRNAMLERVAAAKAGTLEVSPERAARQAEIDQRGEDEMVIAGLRPLEGVTMKAAQGVPFVGEWVDEAIGTFDPEGAERVRTVQGAMDRQRPGAALAAEIGGGVVGSIPLAVTGVGIAGQAASRGGMALRGAGLGAGGGALEGAAQGSGANPDNRVAGGVRGAVVGGGLGGVIGGLAPLVGEGVQSVARRVKKLDVRSIADELGISIPAARSVKSAVANDDLAGAMQKLNMLGDDAMLADAGASTGVMLDAASKTGGTALRVTREAVEDRSARAGQRLTQTLDDVLGQSTGVRTAARNIAQRTSAARKEAYETAFRVPIDYSTGGLGDEILGVLNRVEPRTLDAAVDRANAIMRDKGITNKQIMASIGDDGSVSFSRMPDLRQMDALKRGLQEQARKAVDIFGRPTDEGIMIGGQARALRDALVKIEPYKKAVKMGGDKIAEDQGLEIGRRLLSTSTTFEEVRDTFKGAPKDVKEAAKRGLRENIEQTLSNVRRTITDPNTDAREAMRLVQELSSRANEKKARLVLGSDAKRLFDELERAEASLALRGMVARNSDTAIRQSVQGQVKGEASPGLIRRTLGKGGNPLDAAQEITETLAGIDPGSMSDRERQIFGEIATALTNTRGEDAKRALTVIQNAMAGQPIKDAEAAAIGRLVAGAGAASAYQGSSQPLMSR